MLCKCHLSRKELISLTGVQRVIAIFQGQWPKVANSGHAGAVPGSQGPQPHPAPDAGPLCMAGALPWPDDLVTAARAVCGEGFFRKPHWGKEMEPGPLAGAARPPQGCDGG